MERELRKQAAGLRTHMLICLGSALIMLLSAWLPAFLGSGDPSRIAAQAVSGIGFLGAGAIMRFGVDVRGVTTSASIWATSAIGLCLGAGYYLPALACLVLAILTLSLFEKLEKRVFSNLPQLKALEIRFTNSEAEAREVEAIISAHGVKVHSVNADLDLERDRLSLTYVVEMPRSLELHALLGELKKAGKVSRIVTSESLK